MVGEQVKLCRVKGPHAERFFAETGNYPEVVYIDQIFDVIWKCHHVNGHVKTPQAIQKLLQGQGIWGVPRPAVQIFVAGCLVCAKNKRVTKQVSVPC